MAKKRKRDPQTHLHIRISEFWKAAAEATARERAQKLNRHVTLTDVVTIALATEDDVRRHYNRLKKETTK